MVENNNLNMAVSIDMVYNMDMDKVYQKQRNLLKTYCILYVIKINKFK